MADLSKKTRFCTICIRKLVYPTNFDNKLVEYLNSFCETYTYIKHDNDINVNGEYENTHYHLVVVYKQNQRLSTRLNNIVDYFGFDNAFGIKVEKTISNIASIQYLIHKNNPEKTQHSIDEIKCNYDRGELKCIIESENDRVTTFDYIYSVLVEEDNLTEVIKRLGLLTYKQYRLVIQDIIKSIPQFRSKYLSVATS